MAYIQFCIPAVTIKLLYCGLGKNNTFEIINQHIDQIHTQPQELELSTEILHIWGGDSIKSSFFDYSPNYFERYQPDIPTVFRIWKFTPASYEFQTGNYNCFQMLFKAVDGVIIVLDNQQASKKSEAYLNQVENFCTKSHFDKRYLKEWHTVENPFISEKEAIESLKYFSHKVFDSMVEGINIGKKRMGRYASIDGHC